MTTKGSFFANGTEVYTEASPAGPADTPVTDNDGPTKSSFFGGTGQPYTSVQTLSATLQQVEAEAAAAAAAAAAAQAATDGVAANAAAALANKLASDTDAASAAASALTATNRAADADSSAVAAGSSATAAGGSATAAANSATAAGNSATAAATSQTNAHTSELNAATSASNANTSAVNAAASAASAASAADTEIAAKAVRFDAAQGLSSGQKTQAQSNMGLGSAATHALTEFAQTGNNLGDLANPAAARSNLGLKWTPIGLISFSTATSVAAIAIPSGITLLRISGWVDLDTGSQSLAVRLSLDGGATYKGDDSSLVYGYAVSDYVADGTTGYVGGGSATPYHLLFLTGGQGNASIPVLFNTTVCVGDASRVFTLVSDWSSYTSTASAFGKFFGNYGVAGAVTNLKFFGSNGTNMKAGRILVEGA